jgi:hypothetical protein
MNFRFATLKALVSAGWVAGFCLVAKAQSGSEQSILFSTPDGQSVSNALLPAATAPGTPQALPDLPDSAPSSFTFTPPQTGQKLPHSQPVLTRRNNSQDEDIRKRMGMQTPAEVMGVPSLQELFGLPKTKTTNSLAQRPYGNGATNMLTAGNTAASDANWAKILSANSDAFNSTKIADSNSLSGGFFDNPNRDSLIHGKKTGDDFDTSSFARADVRQPVWDSAVQIASPANVPGYTPNAAPAPAPPAFSAPSQDSQSPFALPKVGSLETTMPHLPVLPSVSRPNPSSQPAAPSWSPKPPPWLDTMPPLGSMAQRKF